MINRRLPVALLCAMTAAALSACASLSGAPDAPAVERQYVSVINSLSWTNALSGKRDGLRTSWPLDSLQGHKETFPLAQIKQCSKAGNDDETCAWGVMRAQRNVSKVSQVPGGISLDLSLGIEIERSARVREPGFDVAMTMPADVPALRWSGGLKRNFMLVFGEVQHVDLAHGISYDVCALRYDAGGRALDVCAIPYF